MTTTRTPFPSAPFVLMNADTNEHLMPVHNTDPLAPLVKFNRDYPHLIIVRNPGFVDLPAAADHLDWS
jgi:hypothetical protein